MKKCELCKAIKKVYKKCAPEKIIIFGSWARGDCDSYSDVDLIIVLRSKKRFLERLADLYMMWSIPLAVDILAYTPQEFSKLIEEENPLIMKALEEGEVIYEKSAA